MVPPPFACPPPPHLDVAAKAGKADDATLKKLSSDSTDATERWAWVVGQRLALHNPFSYLVERHVGVTRRLVAV